MSDSNPSSNTPSSSNSVGGINVSGGNFNVGGDVVGGDKYVIAAELAYDVRGCENPYLGLAAFTYNERAEYAGREKVIAETFAKITAPASPVALLFVTGASGSGKSSFAQAGLLPALETFYENFAVKRAVMRPAGDPLAALNDAMWRQLQLKTFEVSANSFAKKPRRSLPRQSPQSNQPPHPRPIRRIFYAIAASRARTIFRVAGKSAAIRQNAHAHHCDHARGLFARTVQSFRAI